MNGGKKAEWGGEGEEGVGLGLEWDVCVRVEERRVLGDGGSGRGKGRSKGLMKRVLWVRSVGKGSKVGDVKGLVLGSGEADKSAEKNNGQNVSG